MDSVDRYGLEASFSFTVDGATRSTLQGVMSDIEMLRNALEGLSKASQGAGGIGGLGGKQAKQASDGLKDVRSQFRALRAESRNIDFGDINDPNAFKQGEAGLKGYIAELRKLESQITGTTTSDRELKAQLQSQQKAAQGKIDTSGNQRDALQAAEMTGRFQQIKQLGSAVQGMLNEPISSAIEYQGELAEINKLAGLEQESLAKYSQEILNLSSNTGVARGQVSSVMSDLAGAGKDFSNIETIKAETRAILDNATALGITTEAATGLDIKIGSIFGKSLDMYGGLVATNSRVGSAINSLADKLEDVQISGEDVTRNFAELAFAIGDVQNFRPPDIAAFAAAMSSVGTDAGESVNFMNRLNSTISRNIPKMAQFAGMSETAFSDLYNSDKLGAYQSILEAYANFKGTELEKAQALPKLGIGQAGDQSILQRLSANTQMLIDARRVANEGFSKDLAGNSVSIELSKQAESAAFQTQRVQTAMKNLRTAMGMSITEALTPFNKAFADILETVLNFTQAHPGLTKVITIGTYALGIAAVAVGTLGTAFWGLRTATTESKLALDVLSKGMVPLTGFWQSATTALSAQGLAGAFAGLGTTVSTFATGALAAITSPISLLIAGLVGIYAVLEYLTPGVNILGSVLSAIAAPIGFVTGLVKGFATTLFGGLGERLGGLGASLGGLSPIMNFLGDTVKMVADTFSKFFGMGETSGVGFANAILGMVDVVGGALKILWGAIDLALIKPIQLAVATWETAFSFLGAIVNTSISAVQAALTPFAQIPTFISSVIEQVRAIVSTVTDILTAPFQAATSTINNLWDATGGKIASVFGFLTGKSQETGQQLVSNLAENSPGPTWQIREKWGMTTEAIANGFSQLQEKSKSAGDFVGTAFAGGLYYLQEKGQEATDNLSKTLGNVAVPSLAVGGIVTPPIDLPDVADSLSSMDLFSNATQFLQEKFTGLKAGIDSTISAASIFAVTGLASIAPWLIGFAGLATLVGVVGFNFLGLRDVAVGISKAIWDILSAGLGMASGLVQVFSGLTNFILGIPSAIRGDFSQLGAGLTQIWQGMLLVVESFANGVLGIFSGLGQSVRGIFTGIQQILDFVFDGAGTRISTSLQGAINNIQAFGTSTIAFFSQLVASVQTLLSRMFSGEIVLGAFESLRSLFNGSAQSLTQGFTQLQAGFARVFSAEFLAAQLQQVQDMAGLFVQSVSGYLSALWQNPKAELQRLGGFVEQTFNSWLTYLSGVVESAKKMIGNFMGTVTAVVNKPAEAVGNTVDRIKGLFKKKPTQEEIPAGMTPTPAVTTTAEVILPQMERPQITPSVANIPAISSPQMPTVLLPVTAESPQISAPTIAPLSVPVATPIIPEITSPSIAPVMAPIIQQPITGERPVVPQIPLAPQQKAQPLIISSQQAPDLIPAKIPVPDFRETANSLQSVSSSLGTVGNLASAIAPQFAAPIMAVSQFAGSFSELTPILNSFVPMLLGVFPALSGLIPALSGVGMAVLGLIPGFAGATVAGGGLMAVLSPILAIALPIVGVVGAVAGALFLLKTAFDNNFLGLADAADLVGTPFVHGFEFLKNTLGEAIGFLGQSLTGFSNLYRETVGSFLEPILKALQPLIPFFKGVGAGIFNTFVLPFKAMGVVVMTAMQGIFNVVKPVVGLIGKAIGTAISSLMIPIRVVTGAVGLIRSGFDLVGSAVRAIAAPIQSVQSVISGIIGFFAQIPSTLSGIFSNLWNNIPAPIRWLVENAMGGLANVSGAFSPQERQIPQFAAGGIMPYEGLAYLHPNEFVVNPQATAGNMGALTQLNNTGDLPQALAPVPVPVPTSSSSQPSAPSMSATEEITFSFTFGDIIIQNATNGVQAANEFLDSISPQLERKVRDILRNQVELAK
jgi:phage-related protein